MTLQELQTQHPDLYAAAVNVGVENERKRVQAHVKLGEAAQATDLALKNISEGVDLDVAVQAEYTAVAMKNNAITARGDETPPAVDVPSTDNPEDDDEALANEVAAVLGVEQ